MNAGVTCTCPVTHPPNALHAAIDSAEPAARKIASPATTPVGIGRINDCVYLGLDIWSLVRFTLRRISSQHSPAQVELRTFPQKYYQSGAPLTHQMQCGWPGVGKTPDLRWHSPGCCTPRWSAIHNLLPTGLGRHTFSVLASSRGRARLPVLTRARLYIKPPCPLSTITGCARTLSRREL